MGRRVGPTRGRLTCAYTHTHTQAYSSLQRCVPPQARTEEKKWRRRGDASASIRDPARCLLITLHPPHSLLFTRRGTTGTKGASACVAPTAVHWNACEPRSREHARRQPARNTHSNLETRQLVKKKEGDAWPQNEGCGVQHRHASPHSSGIGSSLYMHTQIRTNKQTHTHAQGVAIAYEKKEDEKTSGNGAV